MYSLGNRANSGHHVRTNAPYMKIIFRSLKSEQFTYISVIIISLFDHIKMSILSWIITNTSDIDPISIVRTNIMINLKISLVIEHSTRSLTRIDSNQTAPNLINQTK